MTVILANQVKNSVTVTNQQKQGGHVSLPGLFIGLPFGLTYASFIGTPVTNQAKHLTTLINQTRS